MVEFVFLFSTKVSFLFSFFSFVSSSSSLCSSKFKSETKLYEQFNKDNGRSFMLSQPSPWGKLFKTSLFKENKLVFPKDLKLYEDLAVIPRIGMFTNKIKHIDKIKQLSKP